MSNSGAYIHHDNATTSAHSKLLISSLSPLNSTTTNRQEHQYLPAPAENHSDIAQHHLQCQHHLKMKLPTKPLLALAPVPEHATRSRDTAEVPQLRASRRCRHLQLTEPIWSNLGWRLRFKRLTEDPSFRLAEVAKQGGRVCLTSHTH